jgi:tRNA(fMet)-specific endonuclease VapC
VKYLLDTNTLVYFFRNAGTVARTMLNTPPVQIGIPAIVVYEIRYGLAKIGNPQGKTDQFNSFLSAVTILPFDEPHAEAAAKIRAALERLGTPIGPLDILIAATALSANATLVTHNTNEFSRVKGLKLADWY